MPKAIRPSVPDDHLFAIGMNLLHAASILQDHMRRSGQDWLLSSFYLQVGFSIELLLKFFLATTGSSEEEVKSYGHRLLDAYTECARRGLSFLSMDGLRAVVENLDASHKNLVFRYMPDGVLTIPGPPELVLEVIRQLAEALRPRLTKTWTKVDGPDG